MRPTRTCSPISSSPPKPGSNFALSEDGYRYTPLNEGKPWLPPSHKGHHSYTKGFVSFTPPEIFFDPGYEVIDATMLHARGHHDARSGAVEAEVRGGC